MNEFLTPVGVSDHSQKDSGNPTKEADELDEEDGPPSTVSTSPLHLVIEEIVVLEALTMLSFCYLYRNSYPTIE